MHRDTSHRYGEEALVTVDGASATGSETLDGAIAEAIEQHWQLGKDASVRRFGRGMNSTTWLVSTATHTWGAKAVPAPAAAQFDAGLTVAVRLEAAGLLAGAPCPTMAGAVSVPVAGHQLALMRHVAGRQLNCADQEEQRAWGATLARAHALLQTSPVPLGVQTWHWVDPEAPHLDVEPWIRPAVQAAVERMHALECGMPLTHGILHADPAPEAFLVNGEGQVAIIDWGGVTHGPLLYDIASAQLYAGSPSTFAVLLAGYLEVLPAIRQELCALPDFLRFRWAVQADYFARRIRCHDLTGLASQSENEVGLLAAGRFFANT